MWSTITCAILTQLFNALDSSSDSTTLLSCTLHACYGIIQTLCDVKQRHHLPMLHDWQVPEFACPITKGALPSSAATAFFLRPQDMRILVALKFNKTLGEK